MRDECYSGVLSFIQHPGVHNKGRRLSVDHDINKEAEAAQGAQQKRGCRAGGLARLLKRPHKPPLPSLSLANVRSLTNKMDELSLQAAWDNFTRDCCVLFITETWLHSSIPDPAIELTCFTTQRFDRTAVCVMFKEEGCVCTLTTIGVTTQ